MLDRLLAAYAGFVAATMGTIVVAGEPLPAWARIALGIFNGTGAFAGILSNMARKKAPKKGGKVNDGNPA